MGIFLDVQKMAPLLKPAPVESSVAVTTNAVEEEEDDLYATAPRRPLASDVDKSTSRVVEPALELGASPTQGDSLGWHWAAFVDEKGSLEVSCFPTIGCVLRFAF